MKNTEFLLWGILLATTGLLSAQTTDSSNIKPSYYEVNDFVEDNEGCLKCHGDMKFILEDTAQDRAIVKKMSSSHIVDRDKYYTSVHKSFSCTDCHTYEYLTFPHTIESRFEELPTCMDCHGYDETYAKYHFEDIQTECSESIHHMEGFSCWSCHDPHSYTPSIRTAEDLKVAILFDNNMCLKCHANYNNFSLLTDRKEIHLIESHDWLPNQAAHIASVRCIECHTEINDSILVAHKILPKTGAVRKCEECHSADSRLMHSLYKFKSKEDRKMGFINGVIVNDSFVLGTHQNLLLNKLSLIILFCTLMGISLHIILRIRNKKSS